MTKYPFVALGMAVAFASVVLPSTYSYADRPAAEGGSGSGYRKVQKAKQKKAAKVEREKALYWKAVKKNDEGFRIQPELQLGPRPGPGPLPAARPDLH